ncbi:MAG: hypothetical protein ACRD2T_11435 [Thermoanaerobaculia bacterium]
MKAASAFVMLALAAAGSAAAAPAKIVVRTSGQLGNAIRNVANGGVIELRAGVYPSPAGGFSITNLKKSFTVQAAPGAAVVLDGEGKRPILRLKNGASGKQVNFGRLTFRNGAATPGKTDAGGVTVEAAAARFVRCVFTRNGTSGVAVGGGALRLTRDAQVTLVQSTFEGNGSTRRGGAVEAVGSTLTMTGGRFVGNRSNLPGHLANAAGGAVYLLDSTATFTDVLFSGNEAAWVGGALYAFGTWTEPVAVPRTAVRLERTSFFGNRALPAPGQAVIAATQGGAIHAEDQVTVTVLDSAFADNGAAVGGAVNLYRAALEATGSIFRNHRAGAGDGFGGAIAALSADQADGSTAGGAINRPNARVVLRDSLLQGPLDPGLAAALSGGCMLAGGDGARVSGVAGVPAQGGLEANRAEVLLEGVVFSGCSATRRVNTAASGGALRADLVELEMREGLVLGSNARGVDGTGGGLSLVGATLASLDGVTFAGNAAEHSGGAIQVRGATLDADDSLFLENSVGAGAAGSAFDSRGAALFSIPSNQEPVQGTVQRSLFAGQAGIPVRDVGPPSSPVNCLRYDANRFFVPPGAPFGDTVYVHNTAAPGGLDVPGLNNLIVGTCNKGTANSREPLPPREGVLVAIQSAGAPGQRLGPFLAYAWTGTAATLDGASLTDRFGLVASSPGEHRLALADGESVAVVVEP